MKENGWPKNNNCNISPEHVLCSIITSPFSMCFPLQPVTSCTLSSCWFILCRSVIVLTFSTCLLWHFFDLKLNFSIGSCNKSSLCFPALLYPPSCPVCSIAWTRPDLLPLPALLTSKSPLSLFQHQISHPNRPQVQPAVTLNLPLNTVSPPPYLHCAQMRSHLSSPSSQF